MNRHCWRCHTLPTCKVSQEHTLTLSQFTPTRPLSASPSQPLAPGTIQIQSHHTFFFLNIVKSNTPPSCTHSNCQTMFGILPLLILLMDSHEERKTKNVRAFLLKCKRLHIFSFYFHLLHVCPYRSRRTSIWSSSVPLSSNYIFILTTASFTSTCCHATWVTEALSMGQLRGGDEKGALSHHLICQEALHLDPN